MLGWLELHRGERLSNRAIEEAIVILAQVIIEAKAQVIDHFELIEQADKKAATLIALRRPSEEKK
jgi:hypothetical protein